MCRATPPVAFRLSLEMPIHPEDLTDTRIEQMIRCGTCGYNLHTLPAVGRCPECGSRYNAMGRRMQGIFLPQYNVFPWSDVMTAVLSGAVAVGCAFAFAVQRPLSVTLGLLAAAFLVLTAIAGPMAWRNAGRYFRFRKVEREDDELGV